MKVRATQAEVRIVVSVLAGRGWTTSKQLAVAGLVAALENTSHITEPFALPESGQTRLVPNQTSQSKHHPSTQHN